jgi:hypothetical protein
MKQVINNVKVNVNYTVIKTVNTYVRVTGLVIQCNLAYNQHVTLSVIACVMYM